MARLPIDVLSHLEMHRQHVLESGERMSKSLELHRNVQAQIEASVALLERARTSKWLTNVPTLPKWIDTLPRRKNASESKRDNQAPRCAGILGRSGRLSDRAEWHAGCV